MEEGRDNTVKMELFWGREDEVARGEVIISFPDAPELAIVTIPDLEMKLFIRSKPKVLSRLKLS